MKVLVTGGAGFIGSNLSVELARLGCDVTVLDNLSSGCRSNVSHITDLEVVEGDIRDSSTVNRLVKGVSAIFHLAASVGNKRSIDHPVKDAEINVIGTINVLEAARKNGVQKLIASSSAGIYGEFNSVPIPESHPTEPETPYACSKLCMEKECLSYAKLYGLDSICLRYFNVYGKNQRFDEYGNVIPIFVFSLLNAMPVTIYGTGEQTRDFVHVDDVVRANVRALKVDGVSGAFNIASGTSLSINDLYEKACDYTNASRKLIFAKKRPGDVLHSLADVRKATDILGYRPAVDIDSGLEKYIDWARNESMNSSVRE